MARTITPTRRRVINSILNCQSFFLFLLEVFANEQEKKEKKRKDDE